MACIEYLAPTPINPPNRLQLAFRDGAIGEGCSAASISFHDARGAAPNPPLPAAGPAAAGVKVIVASSTLVAARLGGLLPPALADKPKVFVGVADDALLALPNVTGVQSLSPAESVELRDIWTSAFAGGSIGVLFNNANPSKHAQAAAIANAPPAGVTITVFPVDGLAPGILPGDFQAQLDGIADGTHPLAGGRAHRGLIVLSDPGTVENAAAVVNAVNATETPLKAIYEGREFAEAGGLMAFGPDRAPAYKRAGELACQICRGLLTADAHAVERAPGAGTVFIGRAAAAAEWGLPGEPAALGARGRPTQLV